MAELDSTLLLSTLRAELRAAWQMMHADHGHERLYGFGVYTTDSASDLNVTAFSEVGLATAVARQPEGLDRIEASLRRAGLDDAADLQVRNRAVAEDPVLGAQSLKWSPCDSPLHERGSGLLPGADRIVHARILARDEEDAELDDDALQDDDDDTSAREVFQVAVQVLQEMDRDGVFGMGAQRDLLTLCIWKGDQSNVERYEIAKMLNPPSVAKRFGEEMNLGIRAFYRQSQPDFVAPQDVFN